MDLTISDYKKIANYYQIPKSKNKTYKELAEDVLSSKLCKCIKSVDSYNNSGKRKISKLNNESLPISICRKTIFNNRNIDFYKFKCIPKPKFLHKPKSHHALSKTSKKMRFQTKKTRKRKN
jgi:hypothetical protein